jgi:hypothetical protein
MAVTARTDIDTTSFVIGEYHQAVREDAAVIVQDAGRAAVLAQFTLLGKVAATGKWTPFIDAAAVDGSAETFGIYMGEDIPAADLVAGDVIDLPVVYAGMKFDEANLVFDDTEDLDTVIGATTIHAHSVRSALEDQSLIPMSVDLSTNYENS